MGASQSFEKTENKTIDINSGVKGLIISNVSKIPQGIVAEDDVDKTKNIVYMFSGFPYDDNVAKNTTMILLKDKTVASGITITQTSTKLTIDMVGFGIANNISVETPMVGNTFENDKNVIDIKCFGALKSFSLNYDVTYNTISKWVSRLKFIEAKNIKCNILSPELIIIIIVVVIIIIGIAIYAKKRKSITKKRNQQLTYNVTAQDLLQPQPQPQPRLQPQNPNDEVELLPISSY